MADPNTRQSPLAVIPARGGSKRIPRKNIKPFLGIPLLARTIDIVQRASTFDRIIVSTDDDEIAAVARAAGADVPFRRPAELATDFAATIPVVTHAVQELERQGLQYAFTCCIYPAAVLVSPEDYSAALQQLRESSSADYVFSATTFGYPIQRALRQLPEGGVQMFWPEHRGTRSQDLEASFHDAGQFYFGRRDAWIEGRPFFTERSLMHLLPRYQVQDIDTAEDWERAELLARLVSEHK